MGAFRDLSGRKFCRLTVLKKINAREGVKDKHAFWLCKCDCGNNVVATSSALLGGKTKSCGCYARDLRRKRMLGQNGVPKKKNVFIDCGDYFKGLTIKNEEFMFDKDMFDIVSKHYWSISRGYVRSKTCNRGKKAYAYLHQLVMKNNDKDKEIDHINRNPSDNRRSNLRIVSHLENMQNLSKNKTNTTGFPNVYFNKERKQYYGKFRYDKKIYYGKYCDNIWDAETSLQEKMKEIKNVVKIEDIYKGE